MSFALARTVALSAALAALPHFMGAQPRRAFPDSLTDREFWQFLTSMSEEGGAFPSENFVSNEKTYQYVIPTLERTLTPNGVYLGVGPEQNFTYIVNLKPRLAVIFDIRRQNAMAHLMYKALFELSPTRAAFVSRLFSRPLPASLSASATPAEIFAAVAEVSASDSAFDATWKAIVDRLTVKHRFAMSDSDVVSMRRVFTAFKEAGPDISYAYRLGAPPPSVTQWHVTYAQLQSLTNADSVNMAFLANEESYGWIRRLQSRNMVVPVVGDFAGPKAIRAVGEFIAQRGAIVTAFYTSNVEQYLFDGFGAEQRFYKNVATLPVDSTSSFIRTLPAGAGPGPILASGSIQFAGFPLSSTIRYSGIRIMDSSGVRVIVATGVDSAGNPVTTRLATPTPPAVSTTGAFVSGIAANRGLLEAFTAGQLTRYDQVVAQTKTDGWKQPVR